MLMILIPVTSLAWAQQSVRRANQFVEEDLFAQSPEAAPEEALTDDPSPENGLSEQRKSLPPTRIPRSNKNRGNNGPNARNEPSSLESRGTIEEVEIKVKSPAVPNPFTKPKGRMMGDMDMGGYGDMADMEGMEGMMGGMDMDMGMGMEMEMGGMGGEMGMSMEAAEDHDFRQGLRRAITALRNAKSGDEKETLRDYVRIAFEKRYQAMITQRKKDISRLKQSVARLEAEMQRREAAKDRVVQLQLQSVQLAAEGILEPNELLPTAR